MAYAAHCAADVPRPFWNLTGCVPAKTLTNEERHQALTLQTLEKRRLRNDLVLTHKVLYNRTDLEATQLFKFFRRQGLRKLSLRLLHQTGRTPRRWTRFACSVVNNWNRLPLTVASVPEQWAFKKLFDSYIFVHGKAFICDEPTGAYLN